MGTNFIHSHSFSLVFDFLVEVIDDHLGYLRTSWYDYSVFDLIWHGRAFQSPTYSHQSLFIDKGIQLKEKTLLYEVGVLVLLRRLSLSFLNAVRCSSLKISISASCRSATVVATVLGLFFFKGLFRYQTSPKALVQLENLDTRSIRLKDSCTIAMRTGLLRLGLQFGCLGSLLCCMGFLSPREMQVH